MARKFKHEVVTRLGVGETVDIQPFEDSLSSLRSRLRLYGLRQGKAFKVYLLGDQVCVGYRVERLSDPEPVAA